MASPRGSAHGLDSGSGHDGEQASALQTVVAQPLILLSVLLLMVAFFAILTAHGTPRAERQAAAVAGVHAAFAAAEIGRAVPADPAAALSRVLQQTGLEVVSAWQVGVSEVHTEASGMVVMRLPLSVAFAAPEGNDPFPRLNHEALEPGFAVLAARLQQDPRFSAAIELPRPAGGFGAVDARGRAEALLLAAQLVGQGAPRTRIGTGFADLPPTVWQLRLVPEGPLHPLQPMGAGALP